MSAVARSLDHVATSAGTQTCVYPPFSCFQFSSAGTDFATLQPFAQRIPPSVDKQDQISGNPVALVHTNVLLHVDKTGVYYCHYGTENYEGWNFNSGNYLFTTDTK